MPSPLGNKLAGDDKNDEYQNTDFLRMPRFTVKEPECRKCEEVGRRCQPNRVIKAKNEPRAKKRTRYGHDDTCKSSNIVRNGRARKSMDDPAIKVINWTIATRYVSVKSVALEIPFHVHHHRAFVVIREEARKKSVI